MKHAESGIETNGTNFQVLDTAYLQVFRISSWICFKFRASDFELSRQSGVKDFAAIQPAAFALLPSCESLNGARRTNFVIAPWRMQRVHTNIDLLVPRPTVTARFANSA